MTLIASGKISQLEASKTLSLSLRQTKRLYRRYKEQGIEGLAHRNRAKVSKNKISSKIREEVLELIQNHYSDFGPQLIKEMLFERHSLKLSRESIRALMIEKGLCQHKKRKNKRYFQSRKRRSMEGELIQADGSPHNWFEDRGPPCCLINVVDDATALFAQSECLDAYFQVMENYVKQHGRPMTLYTDRHSIFKSPKSEDQPKLSQFGRATLGTRH